MNCNTTIQIQSVHIACSALSFCHAILQTTYRFVCNFTVTVVQNIYQKYLFSLRSSNFSKISSFMRMRCLLKMIATI